jgi:hypothetical protein
MAVGIVTIVLLQLLFIYAPSRTPCSKADRSAAVHGRELSAWASLAIS